MGLVTQLVGALLVVGSATWQFGPWGMLGGGVLLMLAPEVGAEIARQRVPKADEQ